VKHPEARITLGFRKAVYQSIELSKRENRPLHYYLEMALKNRWIEHWIESMGV